MRKLNSVVLFIFVLLICRPVLADTEINGFASIVAGKVIDGEEFLADYTRAGVYDSDLSFSPDSLAGIQLRSSFDNEFAFVAQLIASSAGDNEAEIDALYLNYYLSSELSIQAGRKQLPLYYYSDYFDVGFAYYWIRPPSDLYTWQITNYNGLSLLYETRFAEWNTGFNVYFGSEKSEENDLLSLLRGGARVDEQWKRMFGVVLSTANEWLEIRLSHMQGLVHREVSDIVIIDDVKQQFLGLSVNLTIDNLIVLSEYNNYERDANDVSVDAMMLSVGYQFDDFTPHITHSSFEQNINAAGNDEKHHTDTVGLRWDITEKSALKIQYDKVTDDGIMVPIKGDSESVSLGLDLVF